MLVTYVFGPRLPASGRCITTKGELAKLAKGRAAAGRLRGRGVPGLLLEPPGPHLPPRRRADRSPPTRPTEHRRGPSRRLAARPERPRRPSRPPDDVHDDPPPSARRAPVPPPRRRQRRAATQHPLALAARPLPGRRWWSWPAPAGSRRSCSTSSCRRRRPLLQTSFVCAADVTEACGPDNAIATFSAEEDRVNVTPRRGARTSCSDAVLAAEDRDFFEHGGVDPVGIARAALQRHPGRRRPAGRLDHHPAVRQERLPDHRAHARPQDQGGGARGQARAGARQGARSSSATSTPSTSAGAPTASGAAARAYFGKDVGAARPRRGRLPGRLIRAPGGRRRRPRPRGGRPAAARTVLDAMARGGLHRPRPQRDAADAEPWVEGDTIVPRPRPPGPRRRSSGDEYRHRVLRRGRAPAARRASTARTRSTAAGCGSTRPSTSTCSGRRGTRSPPRSTSRTTPTPRSSPSTSTAT